MSIPCASCAAVPRQRTRNVASSSSIPGLCRVLAVSLFALLAASPARAQSPEKTIGLPEHTPPQVLDGTAIRIGHYNPSQMLRLAIAVTPPHMAEEEQFIHDVTTPNSPIFHQYLSADEWNARFAPSAEDEQRIVDWAKSQGLTVTARFPNRLDVDLEAPAGVIEKAFGVTINQLSGRRRSRLLQRPRSGAARQHRRPRHRRPRPEQYPAHARFLAQASTTTRDPITRPDRSTVRPEPSSATAMPPNFPSKTCSKLSNYTNGYYDPSDLYSRRRLRLQRPQGPGPLLQPA